MNFPFSILLDDNRALGKACGGMLFEQAQGWVVAHEAQEVESAWQQLRAARAKGLWAAGFVSYELGYCLEPKLLSLLPTKRDVPLLCFGLFEAPKQLTAAEVEALIAGRFGAEAPPLPNFSLQWDAPRYDTRFRHVREFLYAGDVYQVNLTFPIRTAENTEPERLYAHGRQAQRARFGAWLKLPMTEILSFSPELFFSLDQGVVTAEPMKGTAARALTWEEDKAVIEALKADSKSQAENLMIVDLLRNDLSKVADIGSVKVRELFSVVTLPTVHQMVSRIQARLKPALDAWDVLQNLFPCGSITGTPKIRAMQIIRDLEMEARGAYCGSIGYVAPDGKAEFNVAIRTLTVQENGAVKGGVGGGLVVDSNAKDEYAECLLKAKFLKKRVGYEDNFALFETMRWSRVEGFVWLEAHLARLSRSADYFGVPFGEAAAKQTLTNCVAGLDAPFLRVKLELDRQGNFKAVAQGFAPHANDALWKVCVSPLPMQSDNVFLYHKTSNRADYDGEYARAQKLGFDEVLFLNERGEVTEGSRSNLFWQEGNHWFTPPLKAGLLPGVLRGKMLREGAVEKTVALAQLRKADAIYLGNALRGLIKANLMQEIDNNDSAYATKEMSSRA